MSKNNLFLNEKQYRIYWKEEFEVSLRKAQENGAVFPPMPLDEYIYSKDRIPALISFDTSDEASEFIANLYDKVEHLSEGDLYVVDDSGIPFGITRRDKWLPENFWDDL